MPVSYSLLEAQTGTPGVVVATLPSCSALLWIFSRLGMAFKQFSLICSDEDQGHPCSMPEVAQELFYNKNWMDDLLHCLSFI